MTVIEKARKILLQSDENDLAAFLEDIFPCFEVRENLDRAVEKQRIQELDAAMRGLSFRRQNDICCACYALCAEYEYAAFADGFQKDAGLILSLLD